MDIITSVFCLLNIIANINKNINITEKANEIITSPFFVKPLDFSFSSFCIFLFIYSSSYIFLKKFFSV